MAKFADVNVIRRSEQRTENNQHQNIETAWNCDKRQTGENRGSLIQIITRSGNKYHFAEKIRIKRLKRGKSSGQRSNNIFVVLNATLPSGDFFFWFLLSINFVGGQNNGRFRLRKFNRFGWFRVGNRDRAGSDVGIGKPTVKRVKRGMPTNRFYLSKISVNSVSGGSIE